VTLLVCVNLCISTNKTKKEFLEPEDVIVLVSVLLYQGLHYSLVFEASRGCIVDGNST